jgi:hypothetical protein
VVTVSDDAPQEPGRLRQDPGLVQEWLRQNNLIYGALIAIGGFMVQPFLTAPSLDLTARICVVAFAVAIPLLAALVMVNRQEAFRRRASRSVLVTLAQVVGELAAFFGVVAGFWHIYWVAGAAVAVTGLVAVGVHSAGYMRLEQDPAPAPPGAEEPHE